MSEPHREAAWALRVGRANFRARLREVGLAEVDVAQHRSARGRYEADDEPATGGVERSKDVGAVQREVNAEALDGVIGETPPRRKARRGGKDVVVAVVECARDLGPGSRLARREGMALLLRPSVVSKGGKDFAAAVEDVGGARREVVADRLG